MTRTSALLAGIGIVALPVAGAPGATYGIDASHGFDASSTLATGDAYDQFRNFITGTLGHTLVPLSNFGAADLAGLDGVILHNNFTQNADAYSQSEATAIHGFAQRAVFVSDISLWRDDGAGSDHPISSNSNTILLRNTMAWLTGANRGVLMMGDDGGGFEIGSFNKVAAPFGVQWANAPVDGGGHVVDNFNAHPVTAGLQTVGVDFQLPLKISAPAVDLTVFGGSDDILAAWEIPTPGTGALLGLGVLGFVRRRR